MSDAFNERLRLIRFRRRREHSKFTQELRIIPKWLVWTCVTLYIIALIIGSLVNLHGIQTGGDVFPPELRSQPVLATLSLAGAITAVAGPMLLPEIATISPGAIGPICRVKAL